MMKKETPVTQHSATSAAPVDDDACPVEELDDADLEAVVGGAEPWIPPNQKIQVQYLIEPPPEPQTLRKIQHVP